MNFWTQFKDKNLPYACFMRPNWLKIFWPTILSKCKNVKSVNSCRKVYLCKVIPRVPLSNNTIDFYSANHFCPHSFLVSMELKLLKVIGFEPTNLWFWRQPPFQLCQSHCAHRRPWMILLKILIGFPAVPCLIFQYFPLLGIPISPRISISFFSVCTSNIIAYVSTCTNL